MDSQNTVSIYLDQLKVGMSKDKLEKIKADIFDLFNENEKKILITKCTNELLESKYKSLQKLSRKVILNYGDLIRITNSYLNKSKNFMKEDDKNPWNRFNLSLNFDNKKDSEENYYNNKEEIIEKTKDKLKEKTKETQEKRKPLIGFSKNYEIYNSKKIENKNCKIYPLNFEDSIKTDKNREDNYDNIEEDRYNNIEEDRYNNIDREKFDQSCKEVINITDDIFNQINKMKKRLKEKYNIDFSDYKIEEKAYLKKNEEEEKKDLEKKEEYKHPESYYLDIINKLKKENLYLQQNSSVKLAKKFNNAEEENTPVKNDIKYNFTIQESNNYDEDYKETDYEFTFAENLDIFYNDILDIFLSKNHNYEEKYYQLLDLYAGYKTYFLDFISNKIIYNIDKLIYHENYDNLETDDDFRELCLDFYDIINYKLISEYLDIKKKEY